MDEWLPIAYAALKATEENAYDIVEISSEVAKEGMVREFTPEEVKELLSNGKYYIMVGKIGEEVAGYVLSTYSWGKIHIPDVAVKKSKRRIGIGMLAVTITAVALSLSDITSVQIVGLLGGLIGSIVGILGAALGLKGSIVSDGKSSSELTYFPSKKYPWTIQDWVAHLFFLSSCLVLTFLLVYVEIFSMDFLHKPLWFAASIL